MTSLNKRLADSNTIFARLAKRVETLTTKLNSLNQAGHSMFGTVPGIGKPGGMGTGAPGGGVWQQFGGSMIFSAFAGQTQVMGAKTGAMLFRLGGAASMATVALGALVGSVYVVKSVFEGLSTISNEIIGAAGWTTKTGFVDKKVIQGIADAFGKSPDVVAKDLYNTPGFGSNIRGMFESIRRAKTDFQASQIAENLGLSDYTGIRRMREDQFQKMMSGRDPVLDKYATSAFDYRQRTSWAGEAWDTMKGAASSASNRMLDVFMNPTDLERDKYWKRRIGTLPPGREAEVRKNSGLEEFYIKEGLLKPLDKKLEVASDKLGRASQNLNDASRYMFKIGRDLQIKGGGDRARRAIPPGWLYYGNHVWMKDYVQSLGAFNL